MIDTRQLNQEQQNAVETTEGPLLVLAGAGSGKTRVVTYRISHLLEAGVPATAILGVTFTNKAAQEMRERVKALTYNYVLICTFHSLGAKILRESIHEIGYKNDFTIYDEEDCKKLLKACLSELDVNEKKMEPKAFKSLISQMKNRLLGPDQDSAFPRETEIDEALPSVYARYQSRLKEYNALDFDDLLFLTVKLFQEKSETLERYQDLWRYLLVDEYQDTNSAQYEIIRLLVAKNCNICVVGDPDQSIYSWRGANIHNILNFERDFPGARVVRLERNYRSCSNILEAANAVIRYNTNRFEKNLWSNHGPGEAIKHFSGATDQEEAQFVAKQILRYHQEHRIPLKNMVVFYRTNFQSRIFEDCFLSKRIPYTIVGGISFYQRKEIKDILAILRIVQSGSDFVSFNRTVNLPKRGIGEATLEKIRLGAFQEGVSILEYVEKLVRGDAVQSPVRLSAKQKQGLAGYLSLISTLARIKEECSLKELVQAAIEESGYLKVLSEDKETFDDRAANVDELIAKAVEWELNTENPTLSAFLEELSLKSTLDEAEREEDSVNLMTIHNGKGLEFPVVFLVGLEEDLFPHANSRGKPEAIEEERRLFYVGMTRAQHVLFLTESKSRYLWGTLRMQRSSRFLREIPSQYVEKAVSTVRKAFF